MKVSVVSGGFDPIHSGHIAYLNAAKGQGDILIVALNSDAWLVKKKGQAFMSFEERKTILDNLSCVDQVMDFADDELGSCINALVAIKKKYPKEHIIFCNGGDRNDSNIPEMSVSGIEFKFSIGGEDKKNSSSWILKKWQGDSEDRVWGKFFNLYQDHKMKLKELIINSKKGMSMQRHFKRDEIWFVSKGECIVKHKSQCSKDYVEHHLKQHDVFKVSQEEWHQIYNPFKEECRIIEIQYGNETSEDDIERLEFYKENNE
jgi:cytidyltransferase-like protein